VGGMRGEGGGAVLSDLDKESQGSSERGGSSVGLHLGIGGHEGEDSVAAPAKAAVKARRRGKRQSSYLETTPLTDTGSAAREGAGAEAGAEAAAAAAAANGSLSNTTANAAPQTQTGPAWPTPSIAQQHNNGSNQPHNSSSSSSSSMTQIATQTSNDWSRAVDSSTALHCSGLHAPNAQQQPAPSSSTQPLLDGVYPSPAPTSALSLPPHGPMWEWAVLPNAAAVPVTTPEGHQVIHTCTGMGIHTHAHTRTHTKSINHTSYKQMHTHTLACMQTMTLNITSYRLRVHTDGDAYTHTCTHTYTLTCTHTNTHIILQYLVCSLSIHESP